MNCENLVYVFVHKHIYVYIYIYECVCVYLHILPKKNFDKCIRTEVSNYFAMLTYAHRMGVDQTNCDPVDIFSLRNQSIENQDYTDKQLCLCNHNFLQ